MASMRPLRDRILLERVEEQEQQVGGIIIPDSARERPQQGRVIAVGTGRVTEDGQVIPLDVKAGDTVLFGKYAGTEVKIDGKEYLIVREDEVLGIVASVRDPRTTSGRGSKPSTGRARSRSGGSARTPKSKPRSSRRR